MMSVLLLMIVAAIFAERRLAQLEGENLLVQHGIMVLYILVQHRSLSKTFRHSSLRHRRRNFTTDANECKSTSKYKYKVSLIEVRTW